MRIKYNALYQCECLSLLERMDAEQVELAYLDPPWLQVGGAWEKSAKEYLAFLSQVLQATWRVLSKKGVIFCHWSSRVPVQVRVFPDQVFGSDQFVTEIIWPQKSYSPRTDRPLVTHESIFVYSKTLDAKFNAVYLPLSEERVRRQFSLADSRGPYRLIDLTISAASRPNQFEWRGYRLPEQRAWKYSKAVLEQLAQQGTIHFPEKPGGLPKKRVYLSETRGIQVGSVWDDIELTFQERNVPSEARFSVQRPISLLRRIIEMASESGDIVLDPFCGIGTTLVAAHQLNRKWIGCEAHPEGISTSLRRLQKECQIRSGMDFEFLDQVTIEKQFPSVHRTYKRLVTIEDLTAEIKLKFVLGQAVEIEETRYYEFKEIKGSGAIDAIKNAADEYAVAFLNSNGGRIFWGIRNNDRTVVGVNLNLEQRDKLRRLVVEKLSTIQPLISPVFYRLELHPIYISDGKSVIADLYVVELTIPQPLAGMPYSTGSGAFFHKTESGIQEIKGQRLPEWLNLLTSED